LKDENDKIDEENITLLEDILLNQKCKLIIYIKVFLNKLSIFNNKRISEYQASIDNKYHIISYYLSRVENDFV
jgi:hypothetical protein